MREIRKVNGRPPREKDKKNRDGCNEERDGRRDFQFVRLQPFPNSQGCDADEEKDERHPGAEIDQPKCNEGHGHIAFRHGLDPTRLPFDKGAGVEVVGSYPDTESRGQKSESDKEQCSFPHRAPTQDE